MIFRDAGHALHVSYLIASLPATQRSPTAVLIDALVKDNHVWDGVPVRQESGVNFSGLTPLEVRGQCAMVRAAVDSLAHPAERAACKAAFGRQVEKADGVRGMAEYLGPVLSYQCEYPLFVAWHVYMAERQRLGVTQADIAKHFGVTLRQVDHDCRKIRKTGRVLLSRALDHLQQRFAEDGLLQGECAVA